MNATFKMRTKLQDPPIISRLRKDVPLTFFSKIANLRCPTCKTLQPFGRMAKTNPHKSWNKFDAHLCNGCSANLYLTGKGRTRRFFTRRIPVFFGGALFGSALLSNVQGLSHTIAQRQHSEPNFFGFLMICFFFIYLPFLALERNEEIKILDTPNDH